MIKRVILSMLFAGNIFDIVINDNKSVVDLKSGKDGIRVKITNENGLTNNIIF